MLVQWFKKVAFLLIAIGFSSANAGSYEDYFLAIVNDNATAVAEFLARGFDPDTVNSQGQPGLLLALQSDSPRVAELLWRQPQLHVDQANAAGETALMIAALRGDLGWCERLVARGASIDRSGWTPLHYAASGPQPKVVAWLLDHGARIDARAPNGSTPLMMAAGYGAIDSADLLVARGADRAARNDARLTAADFARRAGRDALAQRLSPR